MIYTCRYIIKFIVMLLSPQMHYNLLGMKERCLYVILIVSEKNVYKIIIGSFNMGPLSSAWLYVTGKRIFENISPEGPWAYEHSSLHYWPTARMLSTL